MVKSIDSSDLSQIGKDLCRPESVVCSKSGVIVTSNAKGGVSILLPSGHETFVAGESNELSGNFLPNGIAVWHDGSVICANLGEDGGVWQLSGNNQLRPCIRRVDGIDLPPTNSVHLDRLGRLWISVSTLRYPRDMAFRRDFADGFIVLVDKGEPRVVADGIGYCNECKTDDQGRYLYVNETFGRRVLRYPLLKRAQLGSPETLTSFGEGVFPDGLALDGEGCAWVVSIVSNRVIRVAPDGSQQKILEVKDNEYVAAVEARFDSGALNSDAIQQGNTRGLKNISSIAFGGHDMRTVYLGHLASGPLFKFRTQVQGQMLANHGVEPIVSSA